MSEASETTEEKADHTNETGSKQPAKKKNSKSKLIPSFITLLAAFISCLFNILNGATFGKFVMNLLVTVIVFLIMGTIIKMIYDKSTVVLEPIEIDNPEAEEGDVNQNIENINSSSFDDDEDEDE